MEWEKTDATTDEPPGKAQAGEPTASQAGESAKDAPAVQTGKTTAAQAGEILKKAADTPSTVPGAAQVEKSAVDGRTRTEIPGAAQAEKSTVDGRTRTEIPGAARMDEAPAAQSGTDGQDLESEAAQPAADGARGDGQNL